MEQYSLSDEEDPLFTIEDDQEELDEPMLERRHDSSDAIKALREENERLRLTVQRLSDNDPVVVRANLERLYHEQIRQLTASVEELRVSNYELSSQLIERSSTTHDVSRANASYREENERLAAVIEDKEQRISLYQQQLEVTSQEAQDRLRLADEEIRGVRLEAAEQRTILEGEKDKYLDDLQQMMRAFEQERQRTMREIGELMRERDGHYERNVQLHAECERAHKELASWKKRALDSLATVEELRTESSACTYQVEKEHDDELEELKREVRQEQARNERMGTLLQELESAKSELEEQIARYTAEQQDTKSSPTVRPTTPSADTISISVYKTLREEYNRMSVDKTIAEEKLKELDREINSLRELVLRHANADTHSKKLEEQLREERVRCKELEKRISSLTLEYQQLLEDYQARVREFKESVK